MSMGSAPNRVTAPAILKPLKIRKSSTARGNRSVARIACSRSAFVVSVLSDQLRGGVNELSALKS